MSAWVCMSGSGWVCMRWRWHIMHHTSLHHTSSAQRPCQSTNPRHTVLPWHILNILYLSSSHALHHTTYRLGWVHDIGWSPAEILLRVGGTWVWCTCRLCLCIFDYIWCGVCIHCDTQYLTTDCVPSVGVWLTHTSHFTLLLLRLCLLFVSIRVYESMRRVCYVRDCESVRKNLCGMCEWEYLRVGMTCATSVTDGRVSTHEYV